MRKSLILFLFVVVVSAATLKPTRVTVVGELPESTKLALESEGIACQSDGSRTVLEIWDRETAIRALARSYTTLTRQKDVVENNIANCRTTKTADGTPYRRLFQTLNDDGSAGAIEEDGGDFNWVYDPANPDSMHDGPHAGYVAKPNINLIQEQCSWMNVDAGQRMVREILLQLDPSVVFSAADSERNPAELARLEKFCDEQRRSDFSNNWLFDHGLQATATAADADASLQAGSSAMAKLNYLSAMPNTGIFEQRWCVAENTDFTSGLASVATALNWLNGKKAYNCDTVGEKYGFGLLNALKSESASLGWDWSDRGNLSRDIWPQIEQALYHNLPVIVALGDTSDKSGRVIMLVKFWADEVTYADPATGKLSKITCRELLDAPSHPDGNFVFIPNELANSGQAFEGFEL